MSLQPPSQVDRFEAKPLAIRKNVREYHAGDRPQAARRVQKALQGPAPHLCQFLGAKTDWIRLWTCLVDSFRVWNRSPSEP